ncbi:LysR family transcriptional regulator [Alteribacillus sp. HJP-4]|uniref:LysR family transcriptional regulator n=1 Tax=Alteribacillus sp. HJP-4 TaxID=2775394 RepID=UPI0035CD0824
MNLQTYNLFCYAVEEKSISGAAKRAFLSQPAVTKHIRQLEEHYESLLFQRESNTITLTEAGERLYYYAKNIVQEYEQSKEAINNIRGTQTQSLLIGSSYTLGEYVLPEIISAFQSKSLDLSIQLSISSTPEILEDLEEGVIDAAFVEGEVENPALDMREIARDEIVLIVAAEHPWAKKRNIVPKNLLEGRMIRREKTSATRKIIEKHLGEKLKLHSFNHTLELGTTQAIKSAVISGLGYGYVSRLTVRQELRAGLLHEVNVSGIHIQRPLWVASRIQRFPKESTIAFTDFAQHFLLEKQ